MEGKKANNLASRQKLAPQTLPSRKFSSAFLGVKMLAKFLRSWASDIGTHRRLALCGRAVTFATHMLAETVFLFLGDRAKVAEANDGLRPRRPHRHDFRGAEHSTLGQDARMGMTIILPHRQACGLHCISCSDASLTFSLPWCCCLACGASLAPQLVCPLLNILPRHVARALFGTHEQPVRCGLVRGLPIGVRQCSADEWPGSCHDLSCLTPLDPQLLCPLLNLLPCHVARAILDAHEHPVHFGLVRGLPRGVRRCPARECSFSRQNLNFAAMPHTSCILEPNVEHKVQDERTLLVYPRADCCHFTKIEQCRVVDERRRDFAVQKRKPSLHGGTEYVVV